MSSKTRNLLLIIVLAAVLLSGCWNYREIDELGIVAGMAIDKTETDKYFVTLEIVSPQSAGQGTNVRSDIVGGEGTTIFEAVRNTITKLGRKAYWGHAQVVIVSEEVAKQNLIIVMDWILRNAEVRPDMWILVSGDESASVVLGHKEKAETIVCFEINDAMRAEENVSTYVKTHLWDLFLAVASDGISPVIPCVELSKDNNRTIHEICDTFVFRRDKLIGKLNGEETKDLLMVRNELHGGILVDVEHDKEKTLISLEILDNRTKVTPIYQDGELIMKLDITTTVGIAEISQPIDFISASGRKQVQVHTEQQLKHRVESLIEKVQHEFKSDIFYFGKEIEMQKPKLWKMMRNDWQKYFVNIKADVHVKVDIVSSALLMKPIQVGED